MPTSAMTAINLTPSRRPPQRPMGVARAHPIMMPAIPSEVPADCSEAESETVMLPSAPTVCFVPNAALKAGTPRSVPHQPLSMPCSGSMEC